MFSRDPKADPERGRQVPRAPRFASGSRRRSSERPSRSQWLFAAIAIVIVLSLVGSTAGTILVDFAARNDAPAEDDPLAAEDRQAAAIEEQRAIVEANPNDAAAMVLLAQYLQVSGETTEAIQWYTTALTINPNDVNARLSFADMLSQSGRSADSELQYQRVLEIDPANVQAIFYLGDLYQYWRNASGISEPRTLDAIARFQQVLSVAPDSVLATTARERLALLGAGTPVAAAPPAADTVATPVAAP